MDGYRKTCQTGGCSGSVALAMKKENDFIRDTVKDKYMHGISFVW